MTSTTKNYDSYIKEIVCDGDTKRYNYVTKYLAKVIQKPEQKEWLQLNLPFDSAAVRTDRKK